MDDEKRYYGVHWFDMRDCFAILWDDGTWESVKIPEECHLHGRHGLLDLRKCRNKTRTETMNYINEKIESLKH